LNPAQHNKLFPRFLATVLVAFSVVTLGFILMPPVYSLSLSNGDTLDLWPSGLARRLRWPLVLVMPVVSLGIARHVRKNLSNPLLSLAPVGPILIAALVTNELLESHLSRDEGH
jgi:hypothetical protein